MRRYDIDWVRVIAIALLLIYHISIGFQPWGVMIGFITNSKPWVSLWIPMAMLNVWRIPLLFFVSGMGVYFAIQNRNWKELIKERASRILIPFLFGMLFIAPLHIYLMQFHYRWKLSYTPNPAHLWFLGNIFIYVVTLSPIFFYFKNNQDSKIVAMMKKWLGNPFGLLIVVSVFIVEALLVDPKPYELYAMTRHGFFLGFLAFFFGFCFVLSGSSFWNMLLKWRWLFLLLAIAFFSYRAMQFQMQVTSYLLSVESNCWIFSVFGFAHRYLNRPSKALKYLSEAAYPIYIIHMVFLYLASLVIFPLGLEPPLKFLLSVIFTTIGCLIFYEFLIRRVNFIRPLFGLKKNYKF